MSIEVEKIPGLLTFPNIVEKIYSDRKRQHLVYLWEDLFNAQGRLFLTQKRDGFYQNEGGVGRAIRCSETDPTILSPETVVKDGPGGVPHGYKYSELDEYFEDALTVASTAAKIIDEVRMKKLKEWKQLAKVVSTQAEPYMNGEFEKAKEAYMGIKQTSPLVDDPVFTLQDIYLDEHGYKYSFLGWLDRLNPGLTDYYNRLAQKAISKIKDKSKPDVFFRVRVGEVAWFSGLASEMEWSGQSRRLGANAVVNIFPNSFNRKFETKLKGRIQRYVPEVTHGLGWSRMAKSATQIMLIMHELGHTQSSIETGELGDLTSSMKELTAEVNGHRALVELPPSTFSGEKLRMIFACSFAWAMSDIEDYENEIDPKKKEALKSYYDSGKALINHYTKKRCLKVNEDNRTIALGDMNLFREAAPGYAYFLREMIGMQTDFPGVIKRIFPAYPSDSPEEY